MFKVEVPVYKVTTKDYYVFIYCYFTIKTFEKERSSKLLEDGVRYLPIIPTITNVVSCIPLILTVELETQLFVKSYNLIFLGGHSVVRMSCFL